MQTVAQSPVWETIGRSMQERANAKTPLCQNGYGRIGLKFARQCWEKQHAASLLGNAWPLAWQRNVPIQMFRQMSSCFACLSCRPGSYTAGADASNALQAGRSVMDRLCFSWFRARARVHTNSIAIPRWAQGRIRASAADLTCGREPVRGIIVVARRI